jgi:hypothetical protein
MDMPDPLRLIHEMLWRQLCPQCDALGPHALAPDDRMDALARLVCIDCGTFLSWIDFVEARHADAVCAACGLPYLSILSDGECCFAGAGSAPAWDGGPRRILQSGSLSLLVLNRKGNRRQGVKAMEGLSWRERVAGSRRPCACGVLLASARSGDSTRSRSAGR